MITISENATPKNLFMMNPWCNCEKQEYQEFYPTTVVICDTSTISANVRVLLKDMFLKFNIEHSTHHLATAFLEIAPKIIQIQNSEFKLIQSTVRWQNPYNTLDIHTT